jgi:hypothetical protein
MNCILRSYNARQAYQYGKDITPVQRIIMARSDPLVHTEFEFSERQDGISFSSTMQDDVSGCRFKQISYSHPLRWTSIVLPMTDEQEDRAWERAIELEGKKYDLIGLAGFGSEWDIVKPHPDKYWCSEAVAELIKAAYEYDIPRWPTKPVDLFIPHRFHPNGLFFEMYRRLTS